MVPMLDDWARIWVADNCSVGWLSASWKTHWSMVSELGTVNTWPGVMIPSCRAAENVTSLNTDPGSYTLVRARLDGASTTAPSGGGQVGHGQDVAGVGVHHDGRPALGVRGLDLGAQCLLGDVLQRLVEGEFDTGPRLGGRQLCRAPGQGDPARRLLDRLRPVLPPEEVVVLVLESREARPRRPHLTEQRRRQLAGRVDPLASRAGG